MSSPWLPLTDAGKLVELAMLGCLRRRYYHLLPLCLLMPFYWVLMSLGAWKGALQLITNPFFWEKTPHDGTGSGEVIP